MNIIYRNYAVIAILSTLIPLTTQAATPRAMLEKSASYALGNSVHAFSVPTVDSAGKIQFYDIKIDLTVNTDGTVSPGANVTASPSPLVTTRKIVPGTYKETGGTDTCTVLNMTLTNGRIQSFFTCKQGTSTFEFSVANGPVSSGHPFQAELIAEGVNLKPDVATYSWGNITGGTLYLGSCNGYSATSAWPIGVKTNGNQIILSIFGAGTATKAPVFYCGNTLNKI